MIMDSEESKWMASETDDDD